MSTTTYRDSPSSTPLSRRPKRASSISSHPMNPERTTNASQIDHFALARTPADDSSLSSRQSFQIKAQHLPPQATPPLPDLRPRTRSNNTDHSPKPKQTYTFSNVPRELDRSARSPKAHQLRQRISSAPSEKPSQISPRSQLKSSSASQSITTRTHQITSQHQPTPPSSRPLPQPSSEQERSKVPPAVQKRRLILMLHHPALKEQQNNAQPTPPPPLRPPPNETPVPPLILEDDRFDQPNIDAIKESEPEMADSLDLIRALREINKEDAVLRSSPSPREVKLDPNKYSFVASNSSDNTTFLLSPRTLTPSEERAVQSRHSQCYRQEMRCSVHAKLPTLIASIVLDNSNSTLERTASLHDKTITLRFNSNGTMKTENPLDAPAPLQATMENEKIDLFYDATLNGFYDPTTGLYYELKST